MSELEKVLREFDFEKVHKVMTALDWTYSNGEIPDVDELRKTAEDVLKTAIKIRKTEKDIKAVCSTGGFTGKCSKKGHLTLMFVVEEYGTW